MTATDMIAILKDFGFPVLVAVALGWFVLHLLQEHKAERKEDREAHLGALDKMSLRLEHNTDAVDALGKEVMQLRIVASGK